MAPVLVVFKMAQVGCNLTEAEAEALKVYADSLELTRASVCVLLVQVELRRRRLARLAKRRSPLVTEPLVKRVTAHIENKALKDAFAIHVETCGLGSDDAAALIFRAELQERFLFKLLGGSWNHA